MSNAQQRLLVAKPRVNKCFNRKTEHVDKHGERPSHHINRCDHDLMMPQIVFGCIKWVSKLRGLTKMRLL